MRSESRTWASATTSTRGASEHSYRTLRESLADLASTPLRRWRNGGQSNLQEEFWALEDVNFEVQPGEVVGIIGRNGAGKSTLLKILSRITKPTTGQVTLRGRVGSLLEVGTGFHPELTGRENVYLNGSILGMSRREIDRKFDEIVAFAEVEQFLDTPVKRYSSGMYVRLAFAVAAYLQPDILVVDEVLAVGDAQFQKKCLGKMRDVGQSGRTVLFVSHNLATLEALCGQCILLERGRVKAQGETESILAQYHDHQGGDGSGTWDLSNHQGRPRDCRPMMTRITLGDGKNESVTRVRMGSPLSVRVEFDPDGVTIGPVLGVVIKTGLGSPVFGVNNRFIPGFELETIDRRAAITCLVPDLPLMPGTYLIDVYLGNPHRDLDMVHEAAVFEVEPADIFRSGRLPPKITGPVYWPASWELQKDSCYQPAS